MSRTPFSKGSATQTWNNAGKTSHGKYPVATQTCSHTNARKSKIKVVFPLGLANKIATFSMLQSCIQKNKNWRDDLRCDISCDFRSISSSCGSALTRKTVSLILTSSRVFPNLACELGGVIFASAYLLLPIGTSKGPKGSDVEGRRCLDLSPGCIAVAPKHVINV